MSKKPRTTSIELTLTELKALDNIIGEGWRANGHHEQLSVQGLSRKLVLAGNRVVDKLTTARRALELEGP